MLCDLPWGLNPKIRQKTSFNKINFFLRTYNPYTHSVLEHQQGQSWNFYVHYKGE